MLNYLTCIPSYLRKYRDSYHLFHETGLAVAVGINLRVQLVHERRLCLSTGGLIQAAAGRSVPDWLFGRTRILGTRLFDTSNVTCSTMMTSAGRTSRTNTISASVMGGGVPSWVNTPAVKRVVITMQSTLLRYVVGMRRVTLAGGIVAVNQMLERATDVLWLALEAVILLLTAAQDTTLVLEFGHGQGGQMGSLMMFGGIVVSFVDGNGGMDNVGLHCFLVDYRLDRFVNVVMDVFTANSGHGILAVCSVMCYTLVSEASLLGGQRPLGTLMVAVVELAMLDFAQVGVMLLGEHFSIMHRLYCSVVVILMHLLVDGSCDVLVTMRLHCLMLYMRGY